MDTQTPDQAHSQKMDLLKYELEQSRFPQRKAYRARFDQLYWADLPLVKESPQVAEAMVIFRKALQDAEQFPNTHWVSLYDTLIRLSTTVGEQMRADDERSSECGAPTQS